MPWQKLNGFLFCLLISLGWVGAVEPLRTRLVDGSGPHEGRVEVFYKGAWGTVCHDHWHTPDANVVCRSLGYDYASIYLRRFGTATGVIVLSYVGCLGTESNLAFCSNGGYEVHSCVHTDDVGVVCEGIVFARLVGGSIDRQGRLEVLYKGTWGTVCDDAFGLDEAHVACRMMGYQRAESYSCCAPFGPGSGSVWLDNLQCAGNEVNIGQCSHRAYGSQSCSHNEDVGITCISLPVRLADGRAPNEGRVEVYYEGSWGAICDTQWDIEEASVICAMLGYAGASKAPGSSAFGKGSGAIILDNVDCDGSETHLSLCGHGGYGVHNCNRSNLAGVVCYGKVQMPIRLVNGAENNQGRLEMLHFGTWNTVCHKYWTLESADVICNMLGYPGVATISPYASFGRGTGLVLMSGPHCTGREFNLLECDLPRPLGIVSCSHDLDFGISCIKNEDLLVRLVSGPMPSEGRVEVYYQGKWGTVCDDRWGYNDANVVCRMLNYKSAANYSCCAAYGEGTEILLDEVDCDGSEHNIGQCRRGNYGVHDCTHAEDVGIKCVTYDIDECSLPEPDYPCDALNGQCKNLEEAYTCSCNKGFQFESDGKTCSDIDECLVPPNDYPCDAVNGICLNNPGSFTCVCNDGFEPVPDAQHCQEITITTVAPTTVLTTSDDPDNEISAAALYATTGVLASLLCFSLVVIILLIVKIRTNSVCCSKKTEMRQPANASVPAEGQIYMGPCPTDQPEYTELNAGPQVHSTVEGRRPPVAPRNHSNAYANVPVGHVSVSGI